MTHRGGRQEKEKQMIQAHEEEIAPHGKKRFQERRGTPETGGGAERAMGTGGDRHRRNKGRSWKVVEWQGRTEIHHCDLELVEGLMQVHRKWRKKS